MNKMTSIITSFMVGFGLTLSECASSSSFHTDSLGAVMKDNPAAYHQTAIQHHEGKALMLEHKIQNLQK